MVTFLGRSLRTGAETRMKEILQAEEDDHGQLRIRPQPRLKRIASAKVTHASVPEYNSDEGGDDFLPSTKRHRHGQGG